MNSKMSAMPSTRYNVICIGADGQEKWRAVADNLVVDTGLDDLISKFFKGAAYTAAHFIGLTSATPTIDAADTMASHAGWTEVVAYDEATREAFTPGAVADGAVDNSAAVASFAINATASVGGLFLTTNSTKSGATGILYGVAAFSGGNKAVSDGDTLNVTCTASVAAA